MNINTYIYRYETEEDYTVIERFPDGHERTLPHDQHDYLAWVADGNTPIVEASGRFLSVVNNEIVVDPNKDGILAAEAVAQEAEEARLAEKLEARLEALPSWITIKAAINAAFPDAKQKTIMMKLLKFLVLEFKGTLE